MIPKVKDTMVLHVGDTFVTQQEVPLLTVETVEIATCMESIDYKTEYKESPPHYRARPFIYRPVKKVRQK